jgi:hypothetical protein
MFFSREAGLNRCLHKIDAESIKPITRPMQRGYAFVSIYQNELLSDFCVEQKKAECTIFRVAWGAIFFCLLVGTDTATAPPAATSVRIDQKCQFRRFQKGVESPFAHAAACTECLWPPTILPQ